MGTITALFHAGITVSDMDRSLVFYRDGLGLEIEFDRGAGDPVATKVVLGLSFDNLRAVFLRIPGGGYVELLEYRGIERLPAASRPCDPGGGHLALYVDDLGAVFDRLSSLGFRARSAAIVDVVSGPNKGGRAIYAVDPDGYAVELVQIPPGDTPDSFRRRFASTTTGT